MNKATFLKNMIQRSYESGHTKITTVSSLAKQAELSRSAIYRYYPQIVQFMKHLEGADKHKPHETTKLSLMTSRMEKLTHEFEGLSEACLALIVENQELMARHVDELLEKDLRISYLEEKLLKYEKPKPRLIR